MGRLTEIRVPVGAIVRLVIRPPDEATRVLFFHAAQEALTNVAAHAKAKTVEIMLCADGNERRKRESHNGAGKSTGGHNAIDGVDATGPPCPRDSTDVDARSGTRLFQVPCDWRRVPPAPTATPPLFPFRPIPPTCFGRVWLRRARCRRCPASVPS